MSHIFKIATWNINSVRIRLTALIEWLHHHQIDVLLLQEIKCQEHQFPFNELEHLNYNIRIVGQKSYNGVAIFSKFPIDEVKTTFSNNPCSEEARYIEASICTPLGYIKTASVYVPNGGEAYSEKYELKLKFLTSLNNYLKSIKNFDEYTIIGGDFNVAPENIDVYSADILKNSTCFTLQERQKIREISYQGYEDAYRLFNPIKQEFSWWDYRAGAFEHNKGMRIDYFFTSANCLPYLKNATIDKDERGKAKASDHAPVILTFQNN